MKFGHFKFCHFRYLFLAVPALAAVLWWFSMGEPDLLQVYFLDVGQGDAIYARSPGGMDMLVDGGPSKIVLERLALVMPWYDRSIDVVVETHPDADHIGGLPHVLERYRVGMFLEPGIESKNVIDDELDRLIKEKKINNVLARAGVSVDLGSGIFFRILYPDRGVSHLKNTNEASIVGQLLYGSTSVMLTGDAPKKVENSLISLYGAELRSDVLKAGHHGSRTSSGEKFVEAVAPRHVIISAGERNRYGHPHSEVLGIFEKIGAQMLRTGKEGTMKFVSDGKSIIRE